MCRGAERRENVRVPLGRGVLLREKQLLDRALEEPRGFSVKVLSTARFRETRVCWVERNGYRIALYRSNKPRSTVPGEHRPESAD